VTSAISGGDNGRISSAVEEGASLSADARHKAKAEATARLRARESR
jgi:hypothetical protein